MVLTSAWTVHSDNRFPRGSTSFARWALRGTEHPLQPVGPRRQSGQIKDPAFDVEERPLVPPQPLVGREVTVIRILARLVQFH
jgi:hypothetical protein